MDGNKDDGKKRNENEEDGNDSSVSPTDSSTGSLSSDMSSPEDKEEIDNNEENVLKDSGSSPSFPRCDETHSSQSVKMILSKSEEIVKHYYKPFTLGANVQETDDLDHSDSSPFSTFNFKTYPAKSGQTFTTTESVDKILNDNTERTYNIISKNINKSKIDRNFKITYVDSDDVEGVANKLQGKSTSETDTGTTNKVKEESEEKAQSRENFTFGEPVTTHMKGIRNTDIINSSDDLTAANNKASESRFVSYGDLTKTINGNSESRCEHIIKIQNEHSPDLFHETIKDAQLHLHSILQKLNHTSRTKRSSPEFDLQSERVSTSGMDLHEPQNNRNPKEKAMPKKSKSDDNKCFVSSFVLHCNTCDTDFVLGRICEDCRVLSCIPCFERIHPLEGKFRNHVVSDVTRYEVRIEKCLKHNLLYSFYCTTCEKKKCSECCASSRDCTHKTIIKLEEYTDKQRKRLENQQKDTSSKCIQKTDMMLSLLDDKAEAIQDRWMFEKEMLQLDFISLHDVITQCETSLMSHFEQEVKDSLRKVADLKHQYGDALEKEAVLTSETLDLLEDKSNMRFSRRKGIIEKKWESLLARTEKLQVVGDDLNPTFFNQKVSLHEEKRYLQERLKIENFSSVRVEPLSSCVYLTEDTMYSPIYAFELWKPPATLLPSTKIGYDVQIKLHTRTVLWHTNGPIDINEAVFNQAGKVFLRPNTKYLIKVTPVYASIINDFVSSLTRGKPCFMLLVTGNEILVHSMKPSFEEQRYHFLLREEATRVNHRGVSNWKQRNRFWKNKSSG